MKNNLLYLTACLIIFAVGFYTGFMFNKNQTVDSKVTTTIAYEKSNVVTVKTIDNPVPYAVQSFLLYGIKDTTYLSEKVDSAAILADYLLTRKYNLDFSNDTLGIFKVDASVSRNKLILSTSYIQPIVKRITTEKVIYKVPTAQFFGLVGSSIDGRATKLQLGVDFKQKYLLGVSGFRINDNYNYTVDLGIKF